MHLQWRRCHWCRGGNYAGCVEAGKEGQCNACSSHESYGFGLLMDGYYKIENGGVEEDLIRCGRLNYLV
jgi:hypothetical protein